MLLLLYPNTPHLIYTELNNFSQISHTIVWDLKPLWLFCLGLKRPPFHSSLFSSWGLFVVLPIQEDLYMLQKQSSQAFTHLTNIFWVPSIYHVQTHHYSARKTIWVGGGWIPNSKFRRQILIRSQRCVIANWTNCSKEKVKGTKIGGNRLVQRRGLWLKIWVPFDLDLKIWAERKDCANAQRQLVAWFLARINAGSEYCLS